jgi:periplasmic mercuric ion binding protein
MKQGIKNLVVILLILMSTNLSAQSKSKIIKKSIKVSGVCGDCKERIEEAVYALKGIKKAEWNKKSHILKVVFVSSKCSQDDIETAIVAIGHDTENKKASDAVYNKLPACCAYRSGVSCQH